VRTTQKLPWPDRVYLAVQIWYWYVRIRLRIRYATLNDLVAWLARSRGTRNSQIEPRRLGRIVARTLPFGLSGSTCLTRSLILYRLLHREGLDPALVVGLPAQPKNHEAHAWIELGGRDVGPPPGGRHFAPLARYRAGSMDLASGTTPVGLGPQN